MVGTLFAIDKWNSVAFSEFFTTQRIEPNIIEVYIENYLNRYKPDQ